MRDYNIVKNFEREINLNTKIISNKKVYTRKNKHKRSVKNIKDYITFLKPF